jgi:hypothetical protein
VSAKKESPTPVARVLGGVWGDDLSKPAQKLKVTSEPDEAMSILSFELPESNYWWDLIEVSWPI